MINNQNVELFSNRLNLWKVEIPISEENKKILENPEIKYIKQTFKELNLKKLSPGDMFLDKEVFSDNIHILVEPPATTGKCLSTFYLSNKKFALSHIIRLGKRKIEGLDEENESQNRKKEKLIGV